MIARTTALFMFILFVLRFEECLGQGRPFYRPAPLRPKQIIPEGPAWPASAEGYAGFSAQQNLRTTSTRRPVSSTTINENRRRAKLGGQNFLKVDDFTLKGRQNEDASWENFGPSVDLRDYPEAEDSRAWLPRF